MLPLHESINYRGRTPRDEEEFITSSSFTAKHHPRQKSSPDVTRWIRTGVLIAIVFVCCYFLYHYVTHLRELDYRTPQDLGTIIEDPAWNAFKDWLYANGVSPLKVELAEFPNYGRGLMLLEDVYEGQVVVELPKHIMLNSEVLRATRPALMQALNSLGYGHLDNALFFTIIIITELADPAGSFWKPYFDIMPRSFPSLPLYYTPAEAQLVDGTMKPLVAWFWGQYEAACEIAQRLSEAHPSTMHHWQFDGELVKWALCAVHSRFWSTPEEGWGGNTLVPLADLLNHHPHGNIVRFESPLNCALIRALSPFRRGTQFFDRYYVYKQDVTDASGFKSFGFLYYWTDGIQVVALPTNFAIAEDDPLLHYKQRALEAMGCLHGDMYTFTNHSTKLPDGYVRCFEATVSTRLEELDRVVADHTGWVLPQLRTNALTRLVDVVADALAAYKSSEDEDMRLLASGTLSYTGRCLVELRLMEKQLYRRVMVLAEQQKELLEISL